MNRVKAVCEWFNTPYYNGIWWEPKPWQSIAFVLLFVTLSIAAAPMLLELFMFVMDSTSHWGEWLNNAIAFLIY